MNEELLIEIIEGLEFGTITIIDAHKKCQNKIINYGQAEQLLYCLGRDKRFELFIALHNTILEKDPVTAFKVFKEAYCSSDNIYSQIKNSKLPFNLKKFLNLVKMKGVNFLSLLNEEEEIYYNELPSYFMIYRGISHQEHISGDYGISWTLSEEQAKNYIYFDKNNVGEAKGGLITENINKKDILSIFSVHGEKELIYII